MHEWDSITASHKHRKHSSVMVKVSTVKSLNFLVNFILLNSSNKTRIMKKLNYIENV